MSEIYSAHVTGGASHGGEGARTARGLAEWLGLAAAPTFAVMALLTALGGGPIDRLCASDSGPPMSGMMLMYLLMSAFHLPPWLRLIFGRSSR